MCCKYEIAGALREMCRRMALVKIPKYCFSDVIRNIHQVNYEDAVSDVEDRFPLEDEYTLDIREFEETLTKQERIALRMKLLGYTNHEIIPFVGVKGDTQMSRLVKDIQGKAALFYFV